MEGSAEASVQSDSRIVARRPIGGRGGQWRVRGDQYQVVRVDCVICTANQTILSGFRKCGTTPNDWCYRSRPTLGGQTHLTRIFNRERKRSVMIEASSVELG